MILPSKHLSQDRALLTVGAMILERLPNPMTVSALWEGMTRPAAGQEHPPRLHYNSFVLALDLLFLVGAIELQEGLIRRKSP